MFENSTAKIVPKVGERNCDVDHRIFFDIEGSEVKFLTVRHRDEAYRSDL